MHYEAEFSVTFEADSDAQARATARLHHEQLRDDLLVEGADHPHEIRLNHVYTNGRDILPDAASKEVWP